MFNPELISNSLQIPSHVLSWLIENILTTDKKNYIWSRVSFNIFGIDEFRSREQNFDIPWNPKSQFKIPNLEQAFNKTLTDIFDQRATEIYNYSKKFNKKIVIMWSGGIDSTAIVCSFIKNLAESELKSITICASLDSLEENPYFYETQIKGRFDLMHLTELNFSTEFLSQNILLHGDPGDCIFGPSVGKYRALCADNLHLRPWKDSLPILYQLYQDPENFEFAGWFVDRLSQHLHELQQKGQYTNIKTVSDWHWWLYFNFKWQGSLARPLCRHKKNPKEKIDSQLLQEHFDLGFFSHADFQIWSYQNLSNLSSEHMRDHKLQAKKYIFEIDKNQTDLENKKKKGSVIHVPVVPLMIDQYGVHHYIREPNVIETFQSLLDL